MYKPLELFIGLRYTRAKRRNHFISFISLISMLGIAVGVWALITVLSVMNGFEKELRERILGMASHATVTSIYGSLRDWEQVADKAARHKNVIGAAPYIRFEGMFTNGQFVAPAIGRGVEPSQEGQVSEIGRKMTVGKLEQLKTTRFGIVLGADLARSLGVKVGEKVTLITPKANVTPGGILPRLKRFTVIGLFQVGMYEYDSGLAVVYLKDAAKLMRLGDEVTGVRLKLDDMFLAPRISRELVEDMHGSGVLVSDWTRRHANFFRAIKTEKTVMFIILFLIVAVAAFNIVSTLVMLVTDKQTDIAILRTMGITPRSVMGIFMVQGMVIGFIGTLIGMACGVATALNITHIVPAIENMLDQKFLPPEIYFISDVPSDMQWSDVSMITLVAFVLSLLATIYPAWRASRTQPAEALRYE